MKTIDLRSDTVTRPTPAMREAIAAAEVGDDVYGEDPTVNRLEAVAAERLGHEAALLVTSGTQGNLCAVMSHCERGDEYIVGQQGHAYKFEGGGAAVLGSVQPQPLELRRDGTLDLAAVEAAIKPDNPHFARTRLLALENTQSGKVLALEYLHAARALADRRGLALHLDGARVFNAAVALGVDVADIARPFDTVSFCLSKGLGAPVGSVLVGRREALERARRWRKVLGGGLRQAGVLAAAGLYALDHHVERLAQDHANARLLAEGLAELPGVGVELDLVHTNMVMASLDEPERVPALVDRLAEHGVRVSSRHPLRLVTHLDVTRADVERFLDLARAFLETEPARASA